VASGRPRLAEDFTVIATDLRGYGDSSKPETTPDHEPYSKRTMALHQISVMRHFGFKRFALCGHDRGWRVGYRMALDHPGFTQWPRLAPSHEGSDRL
jgi:haloacetate dehalogenase